jgi:hypothetical protein
VIVGVRYTNSRGWRRSRARDNVACPASVVYNPPMLMVVFGAGASYDSIPSRVPSGAIKLEERLPLADELFDDRRNL